MHDAEQRRSFIRGQTGRDPGPDPLVEEINDLKAWQASNADTMAAQAKDIADLTSKLKLAEGPAETPFARGYLTGWVTNWLKANPDERLEKAHALSQGLLRDCIDLEAKLKLGRAVMARLEPYLDSIICYASTMGEHEPNQIAHDFRLALKAIGGDE